MYVKQLNMMQIQFHNIWKIEIIRGKYMTSQKETLKHLSWILFCFLIQ